MKKAIIQSGSIQYLVSKGDTIEVELLKDAGKTVSFVPLMVIEGDTAVVGTPEVAGSKVTAKVIEPDVKKDKVTSIRFKAKKRVNKKRGHRQRKTQLEITTIS
ncbi:MAG: 50S ribosomal protein L21 [Patescibacteria group bacterium]